MLALHLPLGLAAMTGSVFLDFYALRGRSLNKITKVFHVSAFASLLWALTIILGIVFHTLLSKTTSPTSYVVGVAYQDYKQIFAGPRWRKLSDAGARVQRLLWASTSTKNPAYRDVMYVEELIGPDTINTMPPETLAAFREHGAVRPSLEENVAAAVNMMAILPHFGISLDDVTTKLTAEGVSALRRALADYSPPSKRNAQPI